LGPRFPTTQWSQVRSAREGTSSAAHRALEALCQSYWPPLYAFVRRQGCDPEEARDLVQAYFAELLEKKFLKGVDPESGRFRSFLLVSLRHFLSHERERARALKRGGATLTISLDTASTPALRGRAVDDLTPEQVFERQWALTVLERALGRLRLAARDAGTENQFEALKPYLTGDAGRTPYAAVGERLGMSEGAVKAGVLRLRRRFGRALREEIAETVSDPDDVDDEIRRMLLVIRPFQGGGA
jgi:RNA polymerase sigma factor (sigma-70 family)